MSGAATRGRAAAPGTLRDRARAALPPGHGYEPQQIPGKPANCAFLCCSLVALNEGQAAYQAS